MIESWSFPPRGSQRVGVRGRPSPDKTLAFCLKGTSTFFDRKMRSRRRPLVPTLTYLSRTKICASGKICSVAPLPTKGLPFAGSLNTQAACKRVSSSCTLYEVFGNFAWRNAPPRKRVAQSGKAPVLRDREVPPRKRRRGARLRGNGDRGTCLTEGEALLRRSADFNIVPSWAKRTFWEKSKLSGFFFQNGVFRLTRFGFYVIL